METVPNPNTPKSEMQKPLHIEASKLFASMPPDEREKMQADEHDPETDLQKFENLFGNLEQRESKPLDDVQKKKVRFEMALQNEYIEREFEQTFIAALIRLRGGIAKAGWPQAFRGAMNVARPELLPIVKASHPEATDQDIENAFATMAFQTMDKIAEGRITTPELEEIRQEVLKAQPSKKEIEPPQYPQPAAFVNAFEAKAAPRRLPFSDLGETPIQPTPSRDETNRQN